MTKLLLIIAIAACGIGRFFIVPRLQLPTWEGSYEAFSHLFAGGLFGAWLNGGNGDYEELESLGRDFRVFISGRLGNRDSFLWCSFWGLSFLELAMFLIQKFLVG